MAQDYLSKVRTILDMAESHEAQGQTEAAANMRAKAEELMQKFRIEQEDLIAQDTTAAGVQPVRVDVRVCAYHTEYRQAYLNLFYVVAQHAGCQVLFEVARKPGETYALYAYTVGYAEDIRYAEMIFTAARLVFAERLEPQVVANLSEQENVYRLRSAGMERVRVAEEIWGNRDKANLAKVGRMYKAECAKRGEEPVLNGRGVTGKVYREQYASEFPWALSSRLQRARDAAGQMGGGLVLHGRKERVQEAFYTEFPDMRPKPAVERAGTEDCGACKKTKHESGKCKDHRPYQETAADRARRARLYSATAMAGRRAGRTAAAHVQLDRAGREAVADGGRGDVERVAFELEG
jgi:hypothetical protein